MQIVYKLTLSDNTIYIGQTKDLNSRILGHKQRFATEHKLTINSVEVLKFGYSLQETLELESKYIRHYIEELGRGAVRNKATPFMLYRKSLLINGDFIPYGDLE